MLLNPKKIEELIISSLLEKPFKTVELVSLIKKKRPSTTKQAVYQALQKLKKEEVVAIHGGKVALSSVWIDQMSDFFLLAQYNYSRKNNLFDIGQGEKIVYHFKTLEHLDIFWSHVFSILTQVSIEKNPVYIYNPHEWFYLARKESDEFLVKKIIKKKKQYLLLFANNTPLDRLLKRRYNRGDNQAHVLDKPIKKGNYYFNIFDDIIVEVLIDEKTSEKIDNLFKKHNKINKSLIKEMKEVISLKGKNKLTISHNAGKARKLKVMFKKYFYIKNSLLA